MYTDKQDMMLTNSLFNGVLPTYDMAALSDIIIANKLNTIPIQIFIVGHLKATCAKFLKHRYCKYVNNKHTHTGKQTERI